VLFVEPPRRRGGQPCPPHGTAGLVKESAGTLQSDMAVVEAEYGDYRRANEDMESALAFAQKPNVLVNAALAFSLTGRVDRANALIEKLRTTFPKDTFINEVWIPVARATQEIAGGHPKRAVDLLESSQPHELGEAAEFLPIYWRGVAYQRANDHAHATIEFQKIIDHRGVSPTSELYPLALLGVARTAVAMGDAKQGREYYGRLVHQWQDAEPDVLFVRQARVEYSKVFSIEK
jgi:eukaryotic-like serine/threonine-protein kinase